MVSFTACDLHLILQLTNMYETSNFEFDYGACVRLDDGHGYSCGIIQFNTGSGSAIRIIEAFESQISKNGDSQSTISPFSSLQGSLDELEASRVPGQLSDNIQGLDGFCAAWTEASHDPIFQNAQQEALTQSYLKPALGLLIFPGRLYPVILGQVYDSAVQMGIEGTKEILKSVGMPKGSEFQQKQWLQSFLNARSVKLDSMGAIYQATKTRIASYRHVLENNLMDWNASRADKTDGLIALNNDGKEITIQCNSSFQLASFSMAMINQPNSADGTNRDQNTPVFSFSYRPTGTFSILIPILVFMTH
jgi:hypothetical protein